MKTPEDVKKGLRNCSDAKNDYCKGCPYDVGEKGNCAICITMVTGDALAYIQQLEREKAALLYDLQHVAPGELCDACKVAQKPAPCEKYNFDCDKCPEECPCRECHNGAPHFQWRGVCPENTKETENNEN